MKYILTLIVLPIVIALVAVYALVAVPNYYRCLDKGTGKQICVERWLLRLFI